MFEITYPVMVDKPFENITYSAVDTYKTGQIFEYDPKNVIHISLMESGFFKTIDNSKCKFTAMRDLELDKEYEYGKEIPFDKIPENLIDDFILAGFVKKVYNPEVKNETKKVTKVSKQKPKKVKKNSYAKIAKELNLTPKKFKTLYFKKFNKEIEDMNNTVSKPTEKKIIEALT